ncbi:hypothetical protein DVH24_024444 [Malus domestica]|uniref:Protein kinase domain-containing protein n=1 Tax=Malus domestica TaxID=3750 RepID=A0A498JGT7_MALDO|nr:hypothetical protein DVH24_024444 [Malus domestica]
MGQLTAKSNVYSFGVVLLEMLSGRPVVDKNRPSGERNLVEWAKPYLASKRKVFKNFDARIEGQYPSSNTRKVVKLAIRCLAADPKSRPNMNDVYRKSQVAISEFKGEKIGSKGNHKLRGQKPEQRSFQVLLLLIQHGANSLNLLEAKHVILVEPLLNPAVEAQAISRVHRIGQKSRTIAHRFIVKDTVEESIYKLNRSRNSTAFIGNTKNQDQPFFTLKDIESLFATVPPPVPETNEKPTEIPDENPTESLQHLPPSVAAAIAAEKRHKE